MDIRGIIENYDLNNLTIAVLGGHSALDVCAGAKKLGFKTLAVCKKGRSQTYDKYYKTQGGTGCIDEVLEVEKFGDVVDLQEELRKRNTIFIHNRYFWVYCDFEKVENDFAVPIFGNRDFVKLEERDSENNQYEILAKAGIRTPRILKKGNEPFDETTLKKRLDSDFQPPFIVKMNEKERKYERAFFVVNSYEDFKNKLTALEQQGKIDYSDLHKIVIEEFIIGAQVNWNFYYCPIANRLELMGTDMRRQTSLDGFLRLDAITQIAVLESGYKPSMIETGHVACTVKESLLEKAFEIGERFVKTTKDILGRPIVGPFALQGAVDSMHGKEELVIFDVSMRIPGSPGTAFTPYTNYLYGRQLSYGERISMSIKEALNFKNTNGEIDSTTGLMKFLS